MKKIPTIFKRDEAQPSRVENLWLASCWWVREGEGIATRKWDGTAVLIRNGIYYKRRELRPGDSAPSGFESLGTDEVTGKTVGWVPVGEGPEDRWHREACSPNVDGTYELVGPKVNGNKDAVLVHTLVQHGGFVYPDVPREFHLLNQWLHDHPIEGIVWHHPDGRMAKIKRRDFGWKW